jgi:uncharacterized membrane protein YqjE
MPIVLEEPLTESPPSVAKLLSGILDDAQTLARQQFDMLKAELKEDVDRTKRAALFGSMGIVLLTVGGLTLVASLVNLLNEQFQFSMWASCLIIGGIATAAGLGLAAVARNQFETFNPLPNKTIDALEENLTWKTQPQA